MTQTLQSKPVERVIRDESDPILISSLPICDIIIIYIAVFCGNRTFFALSFQNRTFLSCIIINVSFCQFWIISTFKF